MHRMSELPRQVPPTAAVGAGCRDPVHLQPPDQNGHAGHLAGRLGLDRPGKSRD